MNDRPLSSGAATRPIGAAIPDAMSSRATSAGAADACDGVAAGDAEEDGATDAEVEFEGDGGLPQVVTRRSAETAAIALVEARRRPITRIRCPRPEILAAGVDGSPRGGYEIDRDR